MLTSKKSIINYGISSPLSIIFNNTLMGYIPLEKSAISEIKDFLWTIPEYQKLSETEQQEIISVLGGHAEEGVFLSPEAENVVDIFFKRF